ncbi:DNA helicase [Alpinimonas psychrophila]|uniref:Uncharacterized protein n=1 Tax=Alpinimonas psychrophila TaxID=748908 RepID=A0A7W3JUA5_9MICO|nr:DNA helicase [Alpinimonas psychrophila]MBA8829343.1 hypothetical protein [Alpinimonas psychrophila]
MSEAEILRAHAEELLHEQQRVLSHAATVVREASRELGRVTSEEVIPRVARGARTTAKNTRDKLVDDVLPSVAAVIGSTLSVIDAARDQRLGQVASRVTALAAKGRPLVVPAVKSAGVGKYIGLGLLAAAVIGIGYVAWQTFRADDELWISEDE